MKFYNFRKYGMVCDLFLFRIIKRRPLQLCTYMMCVWKPRWKQWFCSPSKSTLWTKKQIYLNATFYWYKNIKAKRRCQLNTFFLRFNWNTFSLLFILSFVNEENILQIFRSHVRVHTSVYTRQQLHQSMVRYGIWGCNVSFEVPLWVLQEIFIFRIQNIEIR